MDPLNSTDECEPEPLQGQGQGQNRNCQKANEDPPAVIIQCLDASYQSTLLTPKSLTEILIKVDDNRTNIYFQFKPCHPKRANQILEVFELPTSSFVSCKIFCLKERGLGMNFIFFEVEQNLLLDTDLKMKLMRAGAVDEQGPKVNYFRKAKKDLLDKMLQTNEGNDVIKSTKYLRICTNSLGKNVGRLQNIFQQKFRIYFSGKIPTPYNKIIKSTTTTPVSTTINNLSNEKLKSYNFFTSTIHFGTFVCALKNDVYIDLNGLQEVNITIKIHEDKEKFINIQIKYDPMNEYILTPNGAKNWILFIRHVDPALPKKISEQLKIPTLLNYYDLKESKKSYISLVVDSRTLELRNHAFNLLLDIFKYAENFKFNDRNLLEIPFIPGITQEGYQNKEALKEPDPEPINDGQDNIIRGQKEDTRPGPIKFSCSAIQFGGLTITNKNICTIKKLKYASLGIEIGITFHIEGNEEKFVHTIKYSELNEYFLASKDDKTWMLIFLQNSQLDARSTKNSILKRLDPKAREYYNSSNCNVIFHADPSKSVEKNEKRIDQIKNMFKSFENFKFLHDVKIIPGLVQPSESTMALSSKIGNFKNKKDSIQGKEKIPEPFNFKTDSINFGSYSYSIPTCVQITMKQSYKPMIEIIMQTEDSESESDDLNLFIRFKESDQYILSTYEDYGWILFFYLKDKSQYRRIVNLIAKVYKNKSLSTYYNPESEDPGKRYIALIATCRSHAERNEAFEKLQNMFKHINNFKFSSVTYIPNKDVEMEID